MNRALAPSLRIRKPGGERGSAIILVLLVAVVLTLLGLSYLWFSETEARIANNEQLATQALYLAEGGARVVKRWFDRPDIAPFMPTPAAVDRSLRILDRDGDGPQAPVPVGGGVPTYKEAIDLDVDGVDDLFRQPFRGSDAHTLFGTRAGPDMRIEIPDPPTVISNTDALDLLDALTSELAPHLMTGPLQGRITRVDVFAPPYLDDAGTWVRYGMATVRVTAQLRRGDPNGAFEEFDRVVAQRTIEMVLNETPYRGPFGPLHSCGGIEWSDNLNARWGVVTSMRDNVVPATTGLPLSIPRSIPGAPNLDPIWNLGWDDFGNYLDGVYGVGPGVGEAFEDPWFRFVSGGTLGGLPGIQPFGANVVWTDANNGTPPDPPALQPDYEDRTNRYQGLAFVGCPIYEYTLWKRFAGSGYSDTRYFAWDAGATAFRENGRGPAVSFAQATHGQTGVFFFDTVDSQEPRDTDGDTLFDNLTPAIDVTTSPWHFRGLLFVNAESIEFGGVSGAAGTLVPPGEPWHDENGNGLFDGAEVTGDAYLNLQYPTTLGGTIYASRDDAWQDPGGSGSGATRNGEGRPINGNVNLWGVLFTNGSFQARGAAVHYGSVIARQGVTESSGAPGRPTIYWDETLTEDWPPQTWAMPRVIVSRWASEP